MKQEIEKVRKRVISKEAELAKLQKSLIHERRQLGLHLKAYLRGHGMTAKYVKEVAGISRGSLGNAYLGKLTVNKMEELYNQINIAAKEHHNQKIKELS